MDISSSMIVILMLQAFITPARSCFYVFREGYNITDKHLFFPPLS